MSYGVSHEGLVDSSTEGMAPESEKDCPGRHAPFFDSGKSWFEILRNVR